jgi:hypothetical protein
LVLALGLGLVLARGLILVLPRDLALALGYAVAQSLASQDDAGANEPNTCQYTCNYFRLWRLKRCHSQRRAKSNEG